MLEATQHDHTTFLTLTYDDDNLPENGSLKPADLRNFFKRLRKVAPRKIRYFACGEYGDTTERPHYHAALFGADPCWNGQSNFGRSQTCCPPCNLLRDTWGLGHIHCGTLEQESAAYIAGYVVKKLTSPSDPKLEGRHPEFSRMSNRPGIGCHAMDEVASELMHYNLDTALDVPDALRHGTKMWPLGRYLKRQLRKRIGRDEKAPEAVLEKIKQELSPVREAAFNGSRSFKDEIVSTSRQKVLRLEAREKLYGKSKDRL